MINVFIEFEFVYKFDNGDIILKLMVIYLDDFCDFECVIFYEKKWYKVVILDIKKVKISFIE